MFREPSSTTPDINFADEFGNKRENKETVECAVETIAAGKDACLLPKRGSSGSSGDSLVSHYSSNSRLTPEVMMAPAVGRRSTEPRKQTGFSSKGWSTSPLNQPSAVVSDVTCATWRVLRRRSPGANPFPNTTAGLRRETLPESTRRLSGGDVVSGFH